VAFEVTLEIDPKAVPGDSTVGLIAIRLVKMGGKFVGWNPTLDWRPAVAHFEFADSEERDTFVAAALEIPGVSVATIQ
jgi:hypothetical protein